MNPISHKRTLYIGGLDEAVDETLLRAAFVPFGDILSVNIPYDMTTGKHRGFAFLEFEEIDDASAACDNMHHAEINGKVITVTLAKPATSSLNRGNAVWVEEPGTQAPESSTGKREREAASVRSSTVVVNAPKKTATGGDAKKEEIAPKAYPIPNGYIRCLDCGGWGKDLIQEHGLCNHCAKGRLSRQKGKL